MRLTPAEPVIEKVFDFLRSRRSLTAPFEEPKGETDLSASTSSAAPRRTASSRSESCQVRAISSRPEEFHRASLASPSVPKGNFTSIRLTRAESLRRLYRPSEAISKDPSFSDPHFPSELMSTFPEIARPVRFAFQDTVSPCLKMSTTFPPTIPRKSFTPAEAGTKAAKGPT